MTARSTSGSAPSAGGTRIVTRTMTIRRPAEAARFDCVKLAMIRSGSAILFGEFGVDTATGRGMELLRANVLYGSEPDGKVVAEVEDPAYLGPDYLIDQLFWQYAGLLQDRFDALGSAGTIHSEPAHTLWPELDEGRTGRLVSWLDELVALGIGGSLDAHFQRVQALWFSIIDVVAPHIRAFPHQRGVVVPRGVAHQRDEAVRVRDAMRHDLADPWTLPRLAAIVHLSPKQLSRVFMETYGKTPLAYLTMLRGEEMARLLRETDMTIEEAGRRVGWRSRSWASKSFRECLGVTPRRYRSAIHLRSGRWVEVRHD